MVEPAGGPFWCWICWRQSGFRQASIRLVLLGSCFGSGRVHWELLGGRRPRGNAVGYLKRARPPAGVVQKRQRRGSFTLFQSTSSGTTVSDMSPSLRLTTTESTAPLWTASLTSCVLLMSRPLMLTMTSCSFRPALQVRKNNMNESHRDPQRNKTPPPPKCWVDLSGKHQ